MLTSRSRQKKALGPEELEAPEDLIAQPYKQLERPPTALPKRALKNALPLRPPRGDS
jgi:hypothetical protein